MHCTRAWLLAPLLTATTALAVDLNNDGCEDVQFAANGACVAESASLAGTVTTTADTLVGVGASVGPFVTLGDVHISPRATLDGWVAHTTKPLTIGAGTVVGRRATVGADHILGPNTTLSRAVTIGPRLTTGDGATVGYAADLGSDITLDDGAVVGNLVELGNFTHLGPLAVIARSTTVADGTSLAQRSEILGIVGPDVTIESDVLVSSAVRVRKSATIESGAQLLGNARVGRGAFVESGATVSGVVRANARVCAGDTVGVGEVVRRGMLTSGLASCAAPSIAGLTDTVSLPSGYTMTFRGIGAGTFEMGCKPGRDDPSETGITCGNGTAFNGDGLHTVTLTHEYWCSETEVTQGQWTAISPLNPTPSFYPGASNPPVETVSWHDAAWYANTLSTREGLTSCYTCTGTATTPLCAVRTDIDADPAIDPYECDGYRLPTEAEWEYAARGGASEAYSGSSVEGDVAWHLGNNSPAGTKRAGTKAPNAYGLYDMSGNVFEWVNDWYDGGVYTGGTVSDPLGPTAGSNRAIRGGHFASSGRVPKRSYVLPDVRDRSLGFRLCRSIP